MGIIIDGKDERRSTHNSFYVVFFGFKVFVLFFFKVLVREMRFFSRV